MKNRNHVVGDLYTVIMAASNSSRESGITLHLRRNLSDGRKLNSASGSSEGLRARRQVIRSGGWLLSMSDLLPIMAIPDPEFAEI